MSSYTFSFNEISIINLNSITLLVIRNLTSIKGCVKMVSNNEIKQTDKRNTICGNCGVKNEKNSKFCLNCGTPIDKQANEDQLKQKPSTLLIILGYILAIFGIFTLGIGIVVGLVIGIILYRRDGPDRIHGILITALSLVILILLLLVSILLIYRAYFMYP